MRYLTILLFILGVQEFAFSQKDWNLKETVGFACFSGGTPSKPVNNFTLLIEKRNYNRILSHLKSNNNAKKYLAVYVLEKLSSQNKIELNKKHKKLISDIKSSDELISVCSGCTLFNKVPLKTLFNNENNWINESADFWFERFSTF